MSRGNHKVRYPHLAEEDLMVLVGGGDACAALYDRHSRSEAAEDLTQDAFIKVWRSSERCRAERDSVRTWILSVVRNRGIDQLRARLGGVRKALDALPHEQQQVLKLAHFSGLTSVEIAGRLGLPLGTVKGRMRLGLQKLRNNTELRELASG